MPVWAAPRAGFLDRATPRVWAAALAADARSREPGAEAAEGLRAVHTTCSSFPAVAFGARTLLETPA